VWSFILDFENAANPFEDRKENIVEWKRIAVEFIDALQSIKLQAQRFEMQYRIKPKDALHLACAIEGKCDYFITTDKKIIKQAKIRTIKIISPIDFVIIMEA
jgi:predicted nucleic acid-binding protein